MEYIFVSVLTLGGIALVSAAVLYFCSRKFAVKSDARVGEIYELLPKANCGGCGLAGCQAMAEALVKNADSEERTPLACPVASAEAMSKIFDVLGMTGGASAPMKAVVKCSGCGLSQSVTYDGLETCAARNACGVADDKCGNGCLGCGDCVAACSFGGIKINEETHVAEVDPALCTACGACVKACPRHVIALTPVSAKNRRVYVSCNNVSRGPVAMKECGTSCIGCGKCAKECPFGAIEIVNNLAHIDYEKCRSCRKCVKVCPRNAIMTQGFPVIVSAKDACAEKTNAGQTEKEKAEV